MALSESQRRLPHASWRRSHFRRPSSQRGSTGYIECSNGKPEQTKGHAGCDVRVIASARCGEDCQYTDRTGWREKPMMSIVYLFWMYVALFALIGGMRGWAKELLVSFSVILALALNHVLRRYIPIAQSLPENDIALFWIRTLILLVLVFFGYQTVVAIPHLASRAARERLQDTLFGAI